MNSKKILEDLATQKHPAFTPGDTVAVHIRIKEGEKERTQVFEGIVLKKKGRGNSGSFVVRKISFGVGVERIFPYQCANIEKVEIVRRGKVRRAKLFYIRELQGKSLRIDKDHRATQLDDQNAAAEQEKLEASVGHAKKSKKQQDEAQESASANG